MSLTRDIVATYKGPGAVIRRRLAEGQREDRALMILMGACGLFFVAQTPPLAREAYLTGQELNPMLGAALLAWLVIAPLLLYILAGVTWVVARLFRGKGTAYGARLALFWSLLASSPLVLLNGLVSGFIGRGLELSIVGLAWLFFFLWFWIRGLAVTQRTGAGA